MGFTETARRFGSINNSLSKIGQGKNLQERIDERGKLSKQIFGNDGYLLLTGAGGKHICSACVPVSECANLVVDQTVYWLIVDDSQEANFYVAMLNSPAMTEAIAPFNPKGAFGERHVHALPYRVMPTFDASNDVHAKIAASSIIVARIARKFVSRDAYLSDPNRALASRRSRLRDALSKIERVRKLDELCAAILGTSSDVAS